MSRLVQLLRWLEISWLDAALAVGLSLAAVAEGTGTDSQAFSPAVLLCTAPLIVRRKWPIAVMLVALGGFSIAGDASNLASLLGGLIAAVSVGLDARHPLIGGLVVLGVAVGISLEFGRGSYTQLPIPGFLAPFLLIGSAFLAGRAIASRQVLANQQRERADQLQREQDAAVKAAAESERRHIARELHDVIAHSVGVMVVQAGAARHVMEEKPEAARESLLAVEASGHEAMAELRRLLGVLHENGETAPLSPQQGLDRLEALVARVREAGLPVELRIEGERRALSPSVDIAAYRIVQEALTNALKYAGGAPTAVLIRHGADGIDIDVSDEGKVVAPADGVGRGLTGMRERVALFGGAISAGPRSGGGYEVRAHMPLDASA